MKEMVAVGLTQILLGQKMKKICVVDSVVPMDGEDLKQR
jgi:hypothetical protein